MVKEHHYITHIQTGGRELANPLKNATARNQDVINDCHSLTLIEFPFHQAPSSVGLDLFAWIDQGLMQLQRKACCRRQGSIRNPCNTVELQWA